MVQQPTTRLTNNTTTKPVSNSLSEQTIQLITPMAQIISISHPTSSKTLTTISHIHTHRRQEQIRHSWKSLQRDLKSNGRISCMFSSNNNSSKDQAKKALESALGGKKTEFEKWGKEIKKREEEGGGGGDGGGGWWRRWFGGSDGEHFWHEAQQVGLTLLAIVVAILVLAKGDVLFAVLLKPLLFTLRGPRNGLRYISRKFRKQGSPSASNIHKEESYARSSAKESVASKWA